MKECGKRCWSFWEDSLADRKISLLYVGCALSIGIISGVTIKSVNGCAKAKRVGYMVHIGGVKYQSGIHGSVDII